MKKFTAAVLLLTILLLSFTSCAEKPKTEIEPQSVTWINEFMNTSTSVISYAGDSKEDFERVCARVRELLGEYNALYDIHKDYEGISNLKTVNDNAGISPVEVDGRILDLVEYGIGLYSRFAYLDEGKTTDPTGATDLATGACNIAMGAVLKLWHDARSNTDKNGNHTIPSAQELALASEHTDIGSIVVNRTMGTLYVSDPEASIDVGAIAKGFVTDRIAEALTADAELKVDGYVLNFGGNIRLIGSKGGEDWKVGIQHPDKSKDNPYILKVSARDTSIVTSGDYERYFVQDGVLYHHIIDPDTLAPASYHRSVTVITKDGALADALSTLLFTLHINKGYELVSSLEGVEAMWYGTNGTVTATAGFPTVE